MKNLTLIFARLDKELLGKDVFLVPYYWAQKNNYSLTVVYKREERNLDLPECYCGARLLPLRHKFLFSSLCYLLLNASRIDLLMTFHFSWRSCLLFSVYKLINKYGWAYLKMDLSSQALFGMEQAMGNQGIKGCFYRKIYPQMIAVSDVLSCETKLCYGKMRSWLSEWAGEAGTNRLVFMPNGFDEQQRIALNVKVRDFSEKENIILTVGRLGALPKNTELLLDALADIELNDWKICLVGTIENGFQEYIRDFMNLHPELKDKVSFVGSIHNKAKLWDLYCRSKVFVLTSRWESYGLVLNEAYRFKNFIVSTNVGAASDIVRGKYGTVFKSESKESLVKILNDVTNGNMNIDVYRDKEPDDLFWEKVVEAVKIGDR